MPDGRGRAERRLESALEALQTALRALQAPWMVIGGIAVIAHGVRRLTTDIDVVIRGDAAATEQVIAALAKHGIEPRIPDAANFAAENLVLLMRHSPTGVDLDLSFGWTEFEHDALQKRETLAFGRVRVPMARPEDLVVFKALAGRPKDLEDAATLVVLYQDIDLAFVRTQVKVLAQLAEEPELEGHLESILATAGSHQSDGRGPADAGGAPTIQKPGARRRAKASPKGRSRRRRRTP